MNTGRRLAEAAFDEYGETPRVDPQGITYTKIRCSATGSPTRHSASQCPSACTISSVIFFASPNSIIVFGRKNSSLSTPA